jgi:phosphopantothenoylcysteine decarboxylase/phosphopantothenate--cysteine ligase
VKGLPPNGRRRAARRTGPHVLLGVGGGIAAYKVAVLASRLVQRGCAVRVAMTPHAVRFVGALTFEGLTGKKAILSSTQVDPDGVVPHIAAARAADVFVVAPATADLLARLAAGAASDAVSLLALSCRCPILLAPAMNDEMWNQQQVRQNVEVLKRRGCHFVGPVVGHLAEGYDAIGRMAEPEAIEAAALSLAGSPRRSPRRRQ